MTTFPLLRPPPVALFAAAAAVIAACAGAGPAAAQAEAPARMAVSYADLNLATPYGRDVLEARLSAAVARVCPAGDARDLTARKPVQACRAAALGGVVGQLAQAEAHAMLEARAAQQASGRAAGGAP